MNNDTILDNIRAMHEANEPLSAFCQFPDDVIPQPVTARHMGAKDYFSREKGLFGDAYSNIITMLQELGAKAYWRDTYAGTQISDRFMDQFGCYSLIGKNGFFHSTTMNAWMVYMPAGLYYPWHHHPAEEMYLCLAGEAVFKKQGSEDVTLGQGGIALHQSNQPHALETQKHPVLCYVVWRNELNTPPILTYENAK